MKIKTAYGFVTDLSKPHRHNVSIQLAKQASIVFFHRPTNMACHNLCTVLVTPSKLRALLGLGLNFCPRLTQPIQNTTVNTLITQFKRDIYTQIIFAGVLNDWKPDQRFIGSDWKPDSADIPPESCARVVYFMRLLQ